MAFVPSYKSRLLVGSLSYSAFTTGFNTDVARNMLNISCLPDVAQVFIPGQSSGNAKIDMILDTAYAASSQFASMNTWQTTPQVVSTAPAGFAALSEVWLLLGNEAQAQVGTAVADKVTASVDITCDGRIDMGFALEDEAAITITTTGTARDLTAASTNGAVAHLHVTAFTGLTSNIVTIEDSADGTTAWATIGTFTTATAITSQRLVITGTVRRYLRVVDTAVGTGSTTRQVSLARR